MFSPKVDYFDTIEGKEAGQVLSAIINSNDYVTNNSYNPNGDLYEDNSMTFEEKHKSYIRKHPNMNVPQYLQNLKIISRKR